MIYLFNLGITIISCISIAMIDFYPKIILNNHFRNHLIIFMLKLFIISMFIYFFIHNFSISNYKIFIISGAINFTFFHILEGVVSQKLITKK